MPSLLPIFAVGKSAFGLVVLRHALLQKRTVIYLSLKTPDAWVFRARVDGSGHDVVPFHEAYIKSLPDIRNKSTVLISDSICPPMVSAFTVMITSPRHDRYWELWKSPPCERLYFPPFSWSEMLAMQRSCFPDCNKDEMVQKYALAGGLPRQVFGRKPGHVERDIDMALVSVNLDALAELLNSPELETDTSQSHRLVHHLPFGAAPEPLKPAPDQLKFYEPWRTELASRDVARKVYSKLVQRSGRRLLEMLAQPPSAGGLASFYGEIYEPAALSVLEAGGEFGCFDWETGTTCQLLLPPSELGYFNSTAQLQALFAENGQRLLVPYSKTFTAIDAVLPGGRMANVTINLEHDLKVRGRGKRSAEGLLPAAEALRPGASGSGDIEMHWILPKERYDELVRLRGGNTAKKASPFTLIIPEEQDMLKQVDKLTAAVKEAEEGSGEAAATLARQELDAYKSSMTVQVQSWAELKARVKHKAVCLQFQLMPPVAAAER